MNILLGLAIILSVMGFAVSVTAIVLDISSSVQDGRFDKFVWGGFALAGLPWLVLLVAFGIMIIFGGLSGPSFKEGMCYRAVSEDSTYFIQSGKVMVPVTSQHIVMLEIVCP